MSALSDTFQAGFDWADKKFQEMYPEFNTTLSDLYNRISSNYPSPHSQTLQADIVPQHHMSGISAESIPVTAHLIRSLIHGNVSALMNFSHIYTSFQEIKNKMAHFSTSESPLSSPINSSAYSSSTIKATTQHLSTVLQTILFSFLNFSISLVTFLSDFIGILFSCLLFVFTLHYLLAKEDNIVSFMNKLIVHVDNNGRFADALEVSINAVFACTLKMTLFHGLFTFLSFSVFDVELVYISTFITMFLSLIPLANPVLIAVPACLSLYLHEKLWHCIFLGVSHLFVSWTSS